MTKSSFTMISQQQSPNPWGRDFHCKPPPLHTFSFDINQDKNKSTVAIHVPQNMEATNINLRLELNRHLLHIKRNQAYGEGGMKI